MNRGIVKLVTDSEIDDRIQTTREELEKGLIMIENLNYSFIHEARRLEESGFNGEFQNAFSEKVNQQYEQIQLMNEHNLEQIRNLVNLFDRLLLDTASQDYVYEVELVPVGEK